MPAPPDRVFDLIADYRHGHPRILPPAFTGLEVEEGGVGEGTVIRVGMRFMGRTETFRATVSVPEPGRVLVERVAGERPLVTTFIVEPDGTGSRVTITTESPGRRGLAGVIERYLTRRFLGGVYEAELELLAREAGR
jgi:hypothetical protein